MGPLERVWEMGEERACNGLKAGEKGGNYPAIKKWLNDGKSKR